MTRFERHAPIKCMYDGKGEGGSLMSLDIGNNFVILDRGVSINFLSRMHGNDTRSIDA